MADIKRLYDYRPMEEVTNILARACELAKNKPDMRARDIQDTLRVGHEESVIIFDWLADKHEVDVSVSSHWIRQGRAYVLNNPFPTLEGMAAMLGLGERRAFLIMHILEKRGLIRIKQDFSLERMGRMASFANLARQMKRVAKKYGGRCEPVLLIRIMHVDPMTAMRLAQYGEENLNLIWKDRSVGKERVLL